MSTAEQIIAAHRLVYVGCDCGWQWDADRDGYHRIEDLHAAHVVAALEAAGKAVVELPEAIDEDGQKVWLPAMSEVIAGVEPGRAYVASTIGRGEYDAAKLRELGLVLLAAARVAEGGDQP
ncbi:hypothetical protein [Rhodococcus sp. SGAir0479]|uniref:hypothetical protein n=1 Tax=Rhodococcus sp. SGAir0479 TaxID=2567884 RepID=UPI0010CD6C17|nr:hypothetical protein [Rhodococcus sp. SGAir0479]QCQ91747.1 hypothetical protein E7742_11235 [Rhodococcus sp. SGAir0479]